MQNKNLVLCLVLSMLIMMSWFWVQQKIWPPPPKRPDPEPPLAITQFQWGQLGASTGALALAPGVPGLGDAIGLAAACKTAQFGGTEVAKVVVAHKPEPKRKPAPRKEDPAVAAARKFPHEELTLGDDNSNLKARLTTLGAGVKQLTLNYFQQADRNGKPVWEDPEKKTPQPLELFNNSGVDDYASYLLLDYENRQENDDRPRGTLGKIEWEIAEKGPSQVVFRTDALSDVIVSKTYRLEPGHYHLGLEVRVKRKSDGKPVNFRYQLASPHGLHIEGIWYTSTFRNAIIGVENAKGDLNRVLEEGRHIGLRAGGDVVLTKDDAIRYGGVVVQFFASMVVVIPVEKGEALPKNLARATPTLESAALKGKVGKVSDEKREFVLHAVDHVDYTFVLGKERGLVLPDEGQEVRVVWRTEGNGMLAMKILTGENANEFIPEDIAVRLTSESIALDDAHPEVVHKYVLYNGPLKARLLGQLDRRPDGQPNGPRAVDPDLVNYYMEDLKLKKLTDVGKFYLWSEIIVICQNVMHWLLWVLHTYVMPWSYGLCIILLTVLVRGLMFPVSRKQALTSIRMQQLGPEIKKIQEKYKGDRQAIGAAQMELYRRHGVNPLGGCLVVLLQMPIFLGLYYALQENILFRLAPFLWIKNLAAPDMLVGWTESIPWISRPADHGSFLYLGPYFNLLPVIAVCFMVYQQTKLTPPPTDEQQAMQQKMMKYMMIFFGLMFYKVAAGLCLYFIASSLWGLTERKLLPKRQTALPGTGPEPAKNGLLQRVMARLEERRQPAAAGSVSSGMDATGPSALREIAAGTQSAPGSSPASRSKRRQERNRRKQGRDRGREPTGPAGNPNGSPPDQPGSLLQRLRQWWADLLEQAKKK